MFFFGTSSIKEDENVMQTAISALKFLHTISEQIDTMNSLIIGNVHQTRHELYRFEISN